jgi:hypothetical protein
MRAVNRTAPKSSSHLLPGAGCIANCVRINRSAPAIASRLSRARLMDSRAGGVKRLEKFGFFPALGLARFVQETDRSVSYPQGENQ